MAGESSKRSNLIEVTYQQLHERLSGQIEEVAVEQVAEFVAARVNLLQNVSEPFGRPSDASNKKLDSGTVTLPDGVVVPLNEWDKEVARTISKKFDIDQVFALILYRAYLYNEGLSAKVTAEERHSFAVEVAEAMTQFYYSERLYFLRTLIPLFRADQDQALFAHPIATKYLPKIVPDGPAFAETLITEYLRKVNAPVPDALRESPREATAWAKRNAQEQLVLLEVLFWTMWGSAPSSGALVTRIFETAYNTELGSQQHNSTYLLDEEAAQLQQDSMALWILITIEVLELERVAEEIEISADPADKDMYWASPDALQKIHQVVTSHGNSHFACTYVAWTFVLSRLMGTAMQLKELPPTYKAFFDSISTSGTRSYMKDAEPTHAIMARIGLSPDVGLFRLMLNMLTNSPFFVTSASWRTSSTVTDPNAVAFRSVFKGLLIAIVELVPVEHIADFDGLVEVWIALFGRSEPSAIAGICQQFWEGDWNHGFARRALFDVIRSRFPIQVQPLTRVLRAMAGTGFLDTDPLAASVSAQDALTDMQRMCLRYSFSYFNELPTFAQAIHISQCSGARALYEKLPSSSSSHPGLTYMNLRPLKLPGGSILPAKSVGQLLSSDGGDLIVVAWQHSHSGWKLLLELLTDYVTRRRAFSGAGQSYKYTSLGHDATNKLQALKLEDIGIEIDTAGDESLIIDALNLIGSVIKDPELAKQLLVTLESGEAVVSHTTPNTQPPDLVQLTTEILDDALSRSATQSRASPRTQLITSAIGVLTALLSVPVFSNRVWLYIRSSASLFGSERAAGIASTVLASERITGHYTMTLGLLQLVHQLFAEASSSVLLVLQRNPKLHTVKEEVLMRATRFVHSEIWVEHMAWKYAQLGDRFEIGRRVSAFYLEVFRQASPLLADAPFVKLSQALADALLFKATMSAVNPLVASIVTGPAVSKMLTSTRRLGEARRLVYLLESHLLLARVLLNYKHKSPSATTLCLLEQALCSRVGRNGTFEGDASSKGDPVDALAGYIKERNMGNTVPVVATEVLFALCSSLSLSEGTASTLIAHLSDPEATVAKLVRIVLHPYEDAPLRHAVWNLITLAADKEPALARLFVTGRFRIPSAKGKEKAGDGGGEEAKSESALSVACGMLAEWKELWDLTPKLLASLLRFLDVVWQHAHEHKATLDPIRQGSKFFEHLAGIVAEELGPAPDCETEQYVQAENGVWHSDHHEAVSVYSYHNVVKSHAVHILAADIRMHLQSAEKGAVGAKPPSYLAIEHILKSEDQLAELVPEAASSSYSPELHDQFSELAKKHYPTLSLDHLQAQEPIVEREYGDDFAFTISLLRYRLRPYESEDETAIEDILRRLHTINLNLSLAHVQTTLTESWQYLLLQVVPYLRGDATIRSHLLSLADSLSLSLASEKRQGEMMSNIHSARLSLLLSLLEVAWFSTSDKPPEVERFISTVKNVRGIILNAAQAPGRSILGQLPVAFHRPLLQVVYFCARHSRSLARRPKTINAEQRLAISATLDAALLFVVDGLRVTFDRARLKLDLDVDEDMELLVAVFEQCTRPDLNPSTTLWLTRLQETDAIRASLELFSRMDLVGLSDLSLLRARKRPLYTPHVLTFHTVLAGIPSAAERLAGESILVAYTENAISPAVRAGKIDAVIPELPGERSPAHRAYCAMLSIVTGVATALGRHGQYFESEACGLVQFYAEQIHRALSWTIDDPLSIPLLEEIEQVVGLFGAVAQGTAATGSNDAVRRALQFFTSDALLLLQQLNYALTHPNHLASVFEPITAEERTKFEADRAASASLKTPSEAVDPLRRPFLARLVHRLYRLSGSVVSALISISGAETVLIGEQENWQLSQALIVPHSHVVPGEPASMATLQELANSTLDVLKLLVDRPATQSLTPASTSEKALDVRDSVAVTRRTLEAVLLYAVTQLAMWLSKPEVEKPANEMETDEMAVESTDVVMASTKERRQKRKSLTIAERPWRGMSGDVASEWLSLLRKVQPVMAKSAGVLDEKTVDIVQVLMYFVQDRILA